MLTYTNYKSHNANKHTTKDAPGKLCFVYVNLMKKSNGGGGVVAERVYSV